MMPGTSKRRGFRSMAVPVAFLVVLEVAAPSSSIRDSPVTQSQAVQLQMRYVNFRVTRTIHLQIRRLRGEMFPTNQAALITFDDKNSFLTRVESAEIAISDNCLSELLNEYVFAYPHAALKRLKVEFEGDRLRLSGTMHKGIDMPFEVTGTVSATPDGNVQMHAEKIKSAHIPLTGLLHLFGERLSKLVNANEARGLKIIGDDIVLYPGRIIPPPHIEGSVSRVRVEQHKIVLTFESAKRLPALTPPVEAQNYIYHRGGVLRFGKLTMADSDLEIVDQDPKSLFDFFLADYNHQMAAGYSKNTPSYGFIVYMPDYYEVESARKRSSR